MLRGIKTFVCDNCGHKFKGMIIYREIWKQMDEAHKAPNAHLSISNF